MFARFLGVLAIVYAVPVAAQQGPGALGTVRVFLDCPSLWCDFDHLRREIPFVNWVRDRTAADVHVLGTSRGAGAGGQEVTLTFIGVGRYRARVDTLRYTNGATDNDQERRDELTRVLALGLVPFAMTNGGGRRLRVRHDGLPAAATPEPSPHDPWDFWVFRISGSGSLEGQSRESEVEVDGRISASRVTEAWKLSTSVYAENGREKFLLEDSVEFVATQRSWSASLLSVWSLSDHWSVGGIVDAGHSQFRNHQLRFETGPAIEYSVFPYRQTSSRRLTFRYAIGVGHFRYQDTTVFGRIQETRPLHDLNTTINFRQPWGNLFGGVNGQQYLDNLAQHRVDVFSGINLRIVRGLSLNLFGEVARVKNQINLAAGDLTSEEIIVRQRQLDTDFEYGVSVGLSYTFGSIFSNVVNPRF